MEVKVSSKEDLRELEMSETRIVLLYSTNIEGSNIMKWASEAGLTGRSYVWIATQSVIGESTEGSPELPAGMLGEWSLFFISTNWFSDYSWDKPNHWLQLSFQ